jgi:hypothetical protein
MRDLMARLLAFNYEQRIDFPEIFQHSIFSNSKNQDFILNKERSHEFYQNVF